MTLPADILALPIAPVLAPLAAVLKRDRRAVLEAPPGAGKTTAVPLALLDAGLTDGRIIMLEPRRLAARAAAARMAELLGEPLGETVGYRIRGEAKVSKATRIEVVTEGILTRRLQTDPGLEGIGAVIFDEFHERSLQADLGLALCLEVAGALRDDLALLAMSATLDTGALATLMQAEILTAEGRSYPVETRWLDKPLGPRARFAPAMTSLITHAAEEQPEGDLLAFLPGEGEIRQVAAQLNLPDLDIRPLYGALPFAEQRAALRPGPRRKLVLATSIAETSLTIEGVHTVVDGGRARRARFDPGSGMSRLVTERVTRAEATQRAGRAGRVAEGVAYRLWTRGEEGALAAYPPAEIEAADLAALALELALWGAEAGALPFLTQPPEGALAEAQALLRMLAALDAENRITDHGRTLAAMPLHPRLGHMLAHAGRAAAPLAALLAERDILGRSAPVDLAARLTALRDPRASAHPVNRPALERVRAEAKRLARFAGDGTLTDPAEMAALAYPDRIGARRKGSAPRYLLWGGKGAVLPDEDPLAGAPFLVATDLDGDPREARIRQAAQITPSQLRALFEDEITWVQEARWDARESRVSARRQERLGALVLDDRIWKDAPDAALSAAMLEGVRALGLRLSEAARRFQARVALGRAGGLDLPDLSEEALMDGLDDWLLPFLGGLRSAADWKGFDALPALKAMLDWDQTQALDRAVPARFVTPLGREIPIDYTGAHPGISLRLQEMFGQTTHPTVGDKPLTVTLLSPAGRPLQVTQDLPGFWASSYADVRKDMRGRYPRHPWPEDPATYKPTLRTKARGG